MDHLLLTGSLSANLWGNMKSTGPQEQTSQSSAGPLQTLPSLALPRLLARDQAAFLERSTNTAEGLLVRSPGAGLVERAASAASRTSASPRDSALRNSAQVVDLVCASHASVPVSQRCQPHPAVKCQARTCGKTAAAAAAAARKSRTEATSPEGGSTTHIASPGPTFKLQKSPSSPPLNRTKGQGKLVSSACSVSGGVSPQTPAQLGLAPPST